MMDDRGQPKELDTQTQATTETEQTLSLNTQQAAQQLSVDSRTVRRYITDGIRTPAGATLRLEARQVRTGRGPEYQIYQTDLETFRQERDRAATEGHAAQLLPRPEESQALTTSIQHILTTELERQSTMLSQAQETIQQLAREAGRAEALEHELERQATALSQAQETIQQLAREAGRAEQELESMRHQLGTLEQERNQWQQKALEPHPQPRRVRLLPWQKE